MASPYAGGNKNAIKEHALPRRKAVNTEVLSPGQQRLDGHLLTHVLA